MHRCNINSLMHLIITYGISRFNLPLKHDATPIGMLHATGDSQGSVGERHLFEYIFLKIG